MSQMAIHDRDSVVVERRQHERFDIAVEITLTSEHQLFTALTGDISRGGVFVSTYRDVPLGSAVEMQFNLPTGTARARGIVRWMRAASGETRPGIGITFQDLQTEDRAVLEEFCKARAPLLIEGHEDRASQA
jgi:uncharacterized protein (TIGR02266 family)